MGGKVSIHDVARAASLSPTTVSQALRNVGRIAPATRQRVKDLAARMGYQPNPMLASLAARQFRDAHAVNATPVAVVSVDVTGHIGRFSDGSMDHFVRPLAHAGYRAEPFHVTEEEELRRLLKNLYSRGFQGIILDRINLERLPSDIGWEPFALIVAGPATCEVPFHRAERNVADTMRRALRITAERGYTRPGAAVFLHDPPIDDDLLRHGIFHSFQHLLAGAREYIPPLLARSWDRQSYYAWREAHRPDVIISLNGATYFYDAMIDPELNRRHATLAFELNPRDPQYAYLAGFHNRLDERARTAVIFLDQLIRHGERGIPELPRTILVPSVFHDGPSLPHKDDLDDPDRSVFPGWSEQNDAQTGGTQ
jgi:DNA-binding LacI/PurR family transcriptional regulator